ncbi:MAG: hypothetical protein IKU52_02715 [Clostridia bacterium]|nr:hypothetical protein [Clostridia bacterium]
MFEGSALGHSFTNYVIILELSCTVNGVKESYCDNGCGEKDVITDEAEGHISSEWAREAVAWTINAGLLGATSKTANLFSPKMTVSRAHVTTIFMRFDKLI